MLELIGETIQSNKELQATVNALTLSNQQIIESNRQLMESHQQLIQSNQSTLERLTGVEAKNSEL